MKFHFLSTVIHSVYWQTVVRNCTLSFNVCRLWRFRNISLSNYSKDIKKHWTQILLQRPIIIRNVCLRPDWTWCTNWKCKEQWGENRIFIHLTINVFQRMAAQLIDQMWKGYAFYTQFYFTFLTFLVVMESLIANAKNQQKAICQK